MDLIQFFSNLFFLQRPIQFYRLQYIVDLAELAPDVLLFLMFGPVLLVCLLYVLFSVIGSILKYIASFFGKRQVQAGSMIVGQDDGAEDGNELGNEYGDQSVQDASTSNFSPSGSATTLVGQGSPIKVTDDAPIPVPVEQSAAPAPAAAQASIVAPFILPSEAPPSYVASDANNGPPANVPVAAPANANVANANPVTAVTRDKYTAAQLKWLFRNAVAILQDPKLEGNKMALNKLGRLLEEAYKFAGDPTSRNADGFRKKLNSLDDTIRNQAPDKATKALQGVEWPSVLVTYFNGRDKSEK